MCGIRRKAFIVSAEDYHQPFNRLGTSWFLADECDLR